MHCPNCNTTFVEKRGRRNNKQRWECQERDCGIWFTSELETEELIQNNFKAPNILIFDIENSYLPVAGVWKPGKTHINKNQILQDWYLLSWSAKWLYDDEIFSDVVTSRESINQNDKRITKSLWDLLNKADIVISYNGNMHDIPKSNTRFLIHDLPEPSYYRSIDVYQTISRRFSFSSNSMDYVNYTLGLDRKKEHEGLSLWTKCMNGDKNSLLEMELYNRQDIVSLESMYLRMRNWINNHPNIGMWHDEEGSVCKYCGSHNLEWSNNEQPINSGIYKSFRCSDCTGIGRSKINLMSKEMRKRLVY